MMILDDEEGPPPYDESEKSESSSSDENFVRVIWNKSNTKLILSNEEEGEIEKEAGIKKTPLDSFTSSLISVTESEYYSEEEDSSFEYKTGTESSEEE